jgi:hypothetical protein
MNIMLGKSCRCGAHAAVECPTVADISSASAKLAGWTVDERGFVRCPACSARGGNDVPAAPAASEPDLFGEGRA